MPTALQISDLRLSLGGNEILTGINATINEGEFVGIFGPNGAGKTTLVRAIIGTLRPTAGSITIFGSPPGRATHQIGYMPQGNSGLELTALSARAMVEAVCQGERSSLTVSCCASACRKVIRWRWRISPKAPKSSATTW